MPRKINNDAFNWVLDYRWTGKGAAKVKEGHKRFNVQQDMHDFGQEILLSSDAYWLLGCFRYVHLRGFSPSTRDLSGTIWGLLWDHRGTKQGLKWDYIKKELINFGYIEPLPLNSTEQNGTELLGSTSIPSPVVGPYVPPSVSGLQKKEKKKELPSHLGNARWEEIIKLYPKRVGGLGRSTALKRLSKVEGRWEEFLTAIRNYKDEVEKNGSDGTKFVKQVSTFMNCWEDYLTPTIEETYEERTWRENS